MDAPPQLPPVPDLDLIPEDVAALEAKLRQYLPAEQVATVRHAYAMGAAAHAGQTRRSGEPYITHPVAVASILADLRMDVETLCAAILHDALEDTPLQRQALAAAFGETVTDLVEGVTKLDRLKFRDRQEADAESFRKMLLAMSRDLRVIMIKLADRLHNMRTLDAMADASRRRIARETLDIYAPIAQRLGMNRIRSELQDLGFRALYPRRHAAIGQRIRSQPVVRREAMAAIEKRLGERLREEGLPFRVVGRVKTPYSVYNKMRSERKSFTQVMDVLGFRVVVNTVSQCYQALGVVHGLYKPLDGRFRDFIAIPKANGYQSLHTVLFGPYGSPLEVQIRTEDMDVIAERGIAAHWVYKHGGVGPNSAQARAHDWLRGLLESQQYAGSSLEFLEHVKVDLFPYEVYLFTPKGAILALPRNATALDFAYAVHTDVGNHAVAARVDGKLAPLRSKLASGQRVEIITAKSASPHTNWLDFVVSSKARTAIRHHLKHLEHEDAVDLGHRILDRALDVRSSSLDRVAPAVLEQYLAENRYKRLEELLADIALGNRMPAQVAQALARGDLRGGARRGSDEGILITGAERGVLTYGVCCRPIPGDPIMGYLSAGKGVVVHRIECTNVPEYRKSPDRCLAVGWDRHVEGDYLAELRIDVVNKPGVLAQVAAAVAEAKSNIDSVEYQERDVTASVMHFTIEVKSVRHLADVVGRIRRLSVVQDVQRV
ncbi:MAG: bifunctional (p)ppGpp synthetase/guanosine-3',5'-bis(diphosphate) 3'-pyrophosphohydrolase [Proteobacteria bacterium]|nr:bifunctional (p)ppGpp synthetase/guanosine-3',5'-bis(diphosphate) 3'-pyrophosphohydrolase [Pseudomonadota bacterium]MBS0463634.1 bifunctional (p)ppGpp synthetase/guanosine-3',5'-bis(diphosphate) 3'-pyrophosphohydrolase [Pseudomonadota bacterium]